MFPRLLIFSFILLGAGCIPPPVYDDIKTKKFNSEDFALNASDTLWLLPPLADVQRRQAFFSDSDSIVLRPDYEGEARAREYTRYATRRYLSKKITVADASLDKATAAAFEAEAEKMFDTFKNDTLATYHFTGKLVRALRDRGLKKCLVTRVYWVYTENRLYGLSTNIYYSSNGATRKTTPTRLQSIVITYGGILDVTKNEVTYYKTNVTFGGTNNEPRGYAGRVGREEREIGRNAIIDFAIKAVFRDVPPSLRQLRRPREVIGKR